MSGVIKVKLVCQTWGQLRSIYERDLKRQGFFLKSRNPPELGSLIRIEVTLPSDTSIVFKGSVAKHIEAGGLGGRGPGFDLALDAIPQTTIWLIESSLNSKLAAQTEEKRSQHSAQSVDEVLKSPQSDELQAASSELVAALWKELSAIAKLKAFQVLECPPNASANEIRKAFAIMTKRYHPDRFARYDSDEIKHLSSELFLLIRDAYQELTKQAKRSKPIPKVVQKETPPSPSQSQRAKPAAPPPLPKTSPAKPSSSNAPQPKSSLPNSPKLNSALQHIDDGAYDEALVVLQEEARRSPSNKIIKAHIELAQALRALMQGDRMDAAERLELVLELDPQNSRAAMEIANMRRAAVEQRKQLLSKLMGKSS